LADEAEQKAAKESKKASSVGKKTEVADDIFSFETLPVVPPTTAAPASALDDDIFSFFQPSKNDEDVVV
jgi:hypothetical protein